MKNKQNKTGDKIKKDNHTATGTMGKLKGYLLYLQSRLGKEATSGPLITAETAGESPENDFTGGSAADDALKFQLLQIFLDVLNNHPEKKDFVLGLMEKLMEDPASLDHSEIKFMLNIVEEVLFLADETGNEEDGAVYH